MADAERAARRDDGLEEHLRGPGHQQEGMKCRCANVEFGSYSNTLLMRLPFDLPEMGKVIGDPVCIDTCIAPDISVLWQEGVRTLNSCCGHQKLPPSVVVEGTSVRLMETLGYAHDTTYPDRADIFSFRKRRPPHKQGPL